MKQLAPAGRSQLSKIRSSPSGGNERSGVNRGSVVSVLAGFALAGKASMGVPVMGIPRDVKRPRPGVGPDDAVVRAILAGTVLGPKCLKMTRGGRGGCRESAESCQGDSESYCDQPH
jgi:hypothetical protein